MFAGESGTLVGVGLEGDEPNFEVALDRLRDDYRISSRKEIYSTT